jgi:hypothetical protein
MVSSRLIQPLFNRKICTAGEDVKNGTPPQIDASIALFQKALDIKPESAEADGFQAAAENVECTVSIVAACNDMSLVDTIRQNELTDRQHPCIK